VRVFAWLLLLDTVSDREMALLGWSTPSDGRQSVNASWTSWIVSGAFPLPTALCSFFSMSFCCTLRLRAPLADIDIRVRGQKRNNCD
jgi:hypothetical protein